MNVQELRIGNYLQDIEDRLCRVEKIETDGFYAPAIKGGFTSLPNEPIPLTEKWLNDFGFKKGKNNWLGLSYITETEVCEIGLNLNSGRFSISNLDEGENVPAYAAYKIQYVHQLQNLYFSLVGTELTCAPQS